MHSGLWFRALFGPGDRERARRWHRWLLEHERGQSAQELERFETHLRTDAGSDRILLARARDRRGEPFWAGLEREELLSQHLGVSGATGSGKSFLVLGLLAQLLPRTGYRGIIFDWKGELSRLVIEVLIPALALQPGGEELLRNLRIIRPFDPHYLPMLRITRAEAGVTREVQSFNLSAALQEALGDDLGARMGRTFLRATSLAIELDEPLTIIKEWLETPARFVRDARRSQDPGICAYAAHAFAREQQASLDALLARLDTFLFLPTVRLCLAAPDCVSFRDALESGLTIVDLGDPPAGAETVARFWGGILLGRLTRAILSRPVRPDSPLLPIVFEEFQESLGRHQVAQFARLLSLARFKRVSLWFLNQQPAQIAAVDSALLKLLRTNTGLEVVFRCNLEDAKLFSHALPAANARERAAEARTALLEDMTRLPNRTFYLWLKQAPFHAQKVRSPRLDLEALRAQAAALPDDLLAYIQQGTVALPIEELEAYARQTQPERRAPGGVFDELLGGDASDGQGDDLGLG